MNTDEKSQPTLIEVGKFQSVQAMEKVNETGITLKKGKSYLFEISDVNNWSDNVSKKDSGFKASPFTGWPEKKQKTLSGRIAMLLKPFITYFSEAGYMELVGEVNSRPFQIGYYAKGVDQDGTRNW